jgi:hypothetical protein
MQKKISRYNIKKMSDSESNMTSDIPKKKNNAQIISTLRSETSDDGGYKKNRNDHSNVNTLLTTLNNDITTGSVKLNENEFKEFKVDFLRVLTTLQSLVKTINDQRDEINDQREELKTMKKEIEKIVNSDTRSNSDNNSLFKKNTNNHQQNDMDSIAPSTTNTNTTVKSVTIYKRKNPSLYSDNTSKTTKNEDSASAYTATDTTTRVGNNIKEYDQKLNIITKEVDKEIGNMKRKMAQLYSTGSKKNVKHIVR